MGLGKSEAKTRVRGQRSRASPNPQNAIDSTLLMVSSKTPAANSSSTTTGNSALDQRLGTWGWIGHHVPGKLTTDASWISHRPGGEQYLDASLPRGAGSTSQLPLLRRQQKCAAASLLCWDSISHLPEVLPRRKRDLDAPVQDVHFLRHRAACAQQRLAIQL